MEKQGDQFGIISEVKADPTRCINEDEQLEQLWLAAVEIGETQETAFYYHHLLLVLPAEPFQIQIKVKGSN